VRALVVGLTGAALALVPSSARAGECSHGGGSSGGGSSGGGSSGGSSSGSSSSSSSSSDYSSSESSYSTDSGGAVAACSETSDIVGRSQCRSFGEGWSAIAKIPAFAIELGTFARRLAPSLNTRAGTMAHEHGTFGYRVVDPASSGGASGAMGLSLRISVATRYHLYFGMEGEVGSVVSGRDYGVEMTSADNERMPTLSSEESLYVAGGLVGGARTRLGGIVLGGEVVAGARTVQLQVHSTLGACIITDNHYATEPFVEPRVRAEYFVNPWLAIGAYAGKDLVGGGGAMAGAAISGHLRAFDGGF
jgi:hypothetical protein